MSNQIDCRNAVFYGILPNLAGIICHPASDMVCYEVFNNKVRICRFRVQTIIKWDRIYEQSEQPDTQSDPG